MKHWIGIDPGASGALCILYENGVTQFIDFADTGLSGYINININSTDLVMAAVEKVHSMPGQGVKSTFSFGQRLGELEGMLQTLKVGYELVRPQLWQKTCGVPPKSGKKGIHQTLSKIYPTAPITGPKGGIKDGRCDALGIAHYLRKTYPE